MTQTQYFVAASLDGYIADAQGKLDWLTQFESAEGVREHYEQFLAGIGALAMGSRTYEFVLSHGGPWPYADRPTFVFTRRELPRVAGADIRFTSGAVADTHPSLRAASGGRNLWLVGGGEIAAQFTRAGLVDELWLSVIPVVLGAGAPLFGAVHVALSLSEVTRFGRGLVELRYRVESVARSHAIEHAYDVTRRLGAGG
jgi:dihydrofolate reductase